MGYIKAEDVLPPEILALVQKYVDGTAIYIPRKENGHHCWGYHTGIRTDLQKRNEEIYHCFQAGESVEMLSQRYFLTEKSIQRIIRKSKKE